MSTNTQTYQRFLYKKAPLQEAIFEARFSLENFDVTLPGQIYEKIRKKFPKKNDLNIITVAVGTTPSHIKDPPLIQAPIMQAWNEERTSCLQIGPGIVAANDNKYLDWKGFSESIELLLKSYFDYAKPCETRKVGFRCINRFLIPTNDVTITDYFRFGLALPDTLFGSNGFEVTLLKEFMHDGCDITARIKFASDSLKPNENGVAFLLDIESFTTQNINTNPSDILSKASSCHDLLKIIFESILQDKIRTLLDGAPE